MARHAIDKKSLREDAIQDKMFWMVDWAHRHRNILILAGVLVVTAVVAGLGYRYYRQVEERRLTLAFFDVEKKLADETLDTQGRLKAARDGYTVFVETHPDTRLSPIAWLNLGRLAWEVRDADGARKAYRAVLDHNLSTVPLLDMARMGLAKVEEAEKNLDAAASLYDEMSEQTYGALKAYSLGRIALQKGQSEEARRYFEQAQQGSKDSIVAEWAKQSMDFNP